MHQPHDDASSLLMKSQEVGWWRHWWRHYLKKSQEVGWDSEPAPEGGVKKDSDVAPEREVDPRDFEPEPEHAVVPLLRQDRRAVPCR